MKRFRSMLALVLGIVALASHSPVRAAAGEQGATMVQTYNYITAAKLEKQIREGAPLTIVDIQVEGEFAAHHIKGAIPTYAYPVKSEADKAKLDAVADKISAGGAPLIIVCPRGAGGAERTYQHLTAMGIPQARLFILEKGQAGWGSVELTESK